MFSFSTGKLAQTHSEPKDNHKGKEKASHTRSDETSTVVPSAGTCGSNTAQAKDKKPKKWHSIRKSMKRKRGSGGDDPAPVW